MESIVQSAGRLLIGEILHNLPSITRRNLLYGRKRKVKVKMSCTAYVIVDEDVQGNMEIEDIEGIEDIDDFEVVQTD